MEGAGAGYYALTAGLFFAITFDNIVSHYLKKKMIYLYFKFVSAACINTTPFFAVFPSPSWPGMPY